MATAAAQRLLAASTKIVGAGRNYISRAKDASNPVLKEPVLFLKPTTSFLHAGPTAGPIEVPEPLESLHHEVELAVVISRRARDVPEASAMDFVGGALVTRVTNWSASDERCRHYWSHYTQLFPDVSHSHIPQLSWISIMLFGWRNPTTCSGYALALDMSSNDLQSASKSAGLPWTLGKVQDTFTPISAVIPKSAIKNPYDLELWLKVDDELRQKGLTSDMIFKIPFLISYISSIMTLMEGDVILTGTPPDGVGPVRVGQKIKAGITDLIDVEFDVQRRIRPFSS